jgi:uncharacterized FlaG/YvyC family protein
MDTLRLKNEEVRAVGNMGVNARGDRLDNKNKTVDSRNRRVTRQYKKQTNVVDQQVADSIADAKNKLHENVKNTETETHYVYNDDRLATTYDLENSVNKEETPDSLQEKPTEEPQGLAAAIARAREVKQEETLPPRKASQQKPGVKKI